MGTEITIWAQCPYCEEDVELHSARLQSCPNCNAHFRPSEEEVEESIEAIIDEHETFRTNVATMRHLQKEIQLARIKKDGEKVAELSEELKQVLAKIDRFIIDWGMTGMLL